MTTTLPFQTEQPIFGKIGGISELIHMSDEERLKYNISLDTYRTNLSVMKNERAEGRAEGLVEGKINIAKKLKSMGVSIEIIQQGTGLSIEEINEL